MINASKMYKNVKGFTILEVMIVLLISGLLAATMFTLLTLGIKNWQRGMDAAESQYSARYALYHMTDTIRQSEKQEIRVYNAHHISLGDREFRQFNQDLRNQHNTPIASNIVELTFKKIKLLSNGEKVTAKNEDDWHLIKIELEVGKHQASNTYKTFVKPRN